MHIVFPPAFETKSLTLLFQVLRVTPQLSVPCYGSGMRYTSALALISRFRIITLQAHTSLWPHSTLIPHYMHDTAYQQQLYIVTVL